MKKFKFRSLTMRIWTTFTAFILIIICSISFVYLFVYRSTNDKQKLKDLKLAHDMVLTNGDFTNPIRFNEFGTLKGSEHFIVIADENGKPVKDSNGNTETIDLSKRKEFQDGQGSSVPNNTTNQSISNSNTDATNNSASTTKTTNINMPLAPGNPGIPGGRYDKEVKNWMASFITGDKIYEKQMSESYRNMKFMIVISSMTTSSGQKAYLVSYLPNMNDNTLLYTVLSVGLAFIVIGFFTAKLIANYLSKPLKQLEEYTKKIAHKDWTDPIEVKTGDEIGRLITSMNAMQTDLQKIDREEKMFLQSISHDLKTPVMVIMSHADAIIDGVYIDSVEKTAEIIRDEAISLEKKIKQMLYLNTLDYVMSNTNENTEINFNKLMLHIINRFEVIKSEIDWNLDIDEINIMGNVEKIQVAIENILDNGLRYAKEQISVSLKRQGDLAVLDIFNDGPMIDKVHMDRIFDNLYKDKTGNFGLGLAISKKIINFYGGEISAVNRDNGVSFIIKLPISKELDLV